MKKENKLQARQRRIAAKKRQAMKKWIYLGCGLVVIALIGLGIGVGKKIANDKANAPVTRKYSDYLTKDGRIKGIKIDDYVRLCDLDSVLNIYYADITPTDEDVTDSMETALSDYAELVTEKGVVLEEGDKINLDYVGYVDGQTFEGGDTKGQGTDLTLGSGEYIEGFEEQLVGHAVGDKVTVEVTFPEEYKPNPDMSGKEAVFEAVINGVYKIEITDALIADNVDGYNNVEEYRQYIYDQLYQYNLNNALWNAVAENSEVLDYPEDYLNNLCELSFYSYQSQYEAANQMYYMLYGQYGWNSMEEYFASYGMTAEDLQSMIQYYAAADTAYCLLSQAIFEHKGLSVTEEDKLEFIASLGLGEDGYEEAVNAYGVGYIMQGAIAIAVNRYLVSAAHIME